MAIEWITPKTDWYGEVDSYGSYVGDRFNASDYNRIKGNLEFLKQLAETIYPDFDIKTIAKKNVGEYLYADEINLLEETLETINYNSLNTSSLGETKTYVPNGLMIDYNELNRLERGILYLYNEYNRLNRQKRLLVFNLGDINGF